MRIKTYKKRRKIKSKEENIIKRLMNKCKVSKRDIHKAIFENNGIKYKYYIINKLLSIFSTFKTVF